MFRISRTGGNTNEPLSVWYLLGGTAKNGEDYVRLSGQVLIPAARLSVEVLVLPVLDNLLEGEETVIAQLFLPPNIDPIHPYGIAPTSSRATIVIRDSLTTPPGGPVVSIVAKDPFAREGTSTSNSAAPDTATFVVSRSGPTNSPLAVSFMVSGTASNGIDYLSVASPVIIPAGSRSAAIVVRPINDNRPEPVETLVVTLVKGNSIVAGYELGTPHRAAAVIVDADCARPHCLRLPDGRFNLCIPVDAAHCYRVESTRDFQSWKTICTVPVNEGAAHYVDPDADAAPQGFYRVVPAACDPDDEL